MADKDKKNDKEKKKKKNDGYGKVILVLAIILALCIAANLTIPDIVNDVKAGRKPYRTLKTKITTLMEEKESEEEEDNKSKDRSDIVEADDEQKPSEVERQVTAEDDGTYQEENIE